MGTDLVTCVLDASAMRQVVLYGPAGDGEDGAGFQAVEHPENPVHARARSKSTFLQAGKASLPLFQLAEEEARLGIELKR